MVVVFSSPLQIHKMSGSEIHDDTRCNSCCRHSRQNPQYAVDLTTGFETETSGLAGSVVQAEAAG